MADKPLVTVCTITYNHERYIAAAVQSVLNQTYSHLELVVVDDGSTDKTPDILAGINDPRLVSIRQSNCGPSTAVNHALSRAKGDYLAFFSGDDLCAPSRLEKQLAVYGNGPPRVLFSAVACIDDEGRPLPGGHFAQSLFRPFPTGQAEILERFFFSGNFLCAITAFTERKVLAGRRFDPALYQLQDFSMWLDLVKQVPFEFVPEQLVCYRIRGDGQNLSFPNQGTQRRTVLENYLITQRFFDDMPTYLFLQAFGRHLQRQGLLTPLETRCEQAFLLLRSRTPFVALLGLQRLHALLADPESAAVLEQRYNFTAVSFGNMLKTAQF